MHRGRAIRTGFAAVACSLALPVIGAPAAGAAREPHDLLRAIGQFSPRQLESLDRGDAVAKVLRTDRREIAVMGAVRIRAPRERLLDRYRDVSHLRRSEVVLQAGRFGSAPQPADLAELTFDAYDLDEVKECTPGDCAVRLSADAMARIQRAVDWTSGDAREQAATAWRQVLADTAARYMTNGDAALPEYVNKKELLRVHDELNVLYGQMEAFAKNTPDLARHLREFPRTPLPRTEHFLYWAKADLGVRPVVTLAHQVVYAPSESRAFVATKRIYAMHYIDAGLNWTMITADGDGGFYLTSLDRIRTRSLTSFSRTIVRSIVQSSTRDGMEKMLKASKRSLEAGQ